MLLTKIKTKLKTFIFTVPKKKSFIIFALLRLWFITAWSCWLFKTDKPKSRDQFWPIARADFRIIFRESIKEDYLQLIHTRIKFCKQIL